MDNTNTIRDVTIKAVRTCGRVLNFIHGWAIEKRYEQAFEVTRPHVGLNDSGSNLKTVLAVEKAWSRKSAACEGELLQHILPDNANACEGLDAVHMKDYIKRKYTNVTDQSNLQ